MGLSDWNAILQVNLTAAFVAAQAAYPLMKAAGGGKIINIGSMYSLFGAPYIAAYAASKGAIVQLTKSLAAAWSADNIQVNAILPGWIDTDMTRPARTGSEVFNAEVIARTPAGRWGQPDDFAGPAVFLASAASDFVTGASLIVDGGYSITG
jgi:2-deoxy-D-gluconate 3-dehydrogenase